MNRLIQRIDDLERAIAPGDIYVADLTDSPRFTIAGSEVAPDEFERRLAAAGDRATVIRVVYDDSGAAHASPAQRARH